MTSGQRIANKLALTEKFEDAENSAGWYRNR